MRKFPGWWRGMGLLCVICLTAGCQLPAQMVWSPDGSAAAYRVDDKAFLIDANGKVTAQLGAVVGGFAWSADSKTLYYANSADLANTVTAPDTKWVSPERPVKPTLVGDADGDTPAPGMLPPTTSPTSQPAKFVELQMLRAGKTTTLVKFASGEALHMALSPDQNWLALVCDTDQADTFNVYVYHLPSKRLFVLSDFAGFGICFTGPNRIAYIEPDRIADKTDSLTGKVLEVTLNASAAALDRTPLLDVVPSQTPYMAALGDNLLLTSVPRAFPGKPITDDNKLVCKLFMWTRANNGMVALADDVGPLFSVSPDGQRVLIEKLTAASDQSTAKRELHLIRVNGSDGHVLRDLSTHDAFALWPAWRGNSEITFSSPDDTAKTVTVNGRQRFQYEAVQYKLTDKGELAPIKTLSDSWDAGLKPYIAGDPEASATTEPATAPTTAP